MYQILCDGHLLHDSRLDNPRVINPTCSLELNTSGALTFYLPPTHQYYDFPKKRKSVIELWQDDELLFTGQVLNDEMTMNKIKKIECEGDFGYLLDSIQRPYDYTGDVITLLTQMITAHNAQMTEARKQFTLGTVDVTDPNNVIVRSDSGYSNTLDTLKSKFWDTPLGGYFKTRGKTTRYLDYTVASGVQSSQVIRFGENILDLNRFVRGEDIITALIPLGKQVDTVTTDPTTGDETRTTARVDITSVNGGLDYIVDNDAVALYGLIFGTQTWEDVTEPSILLQRGYDYLAENKLLNITLELTALDLHLLNVDIDRLKLGDSVRVISAPHGIDEYMTINRIDLDITNPQNTKITLGSNRSSLVDSTQSGLGNTANQVIENVRADYVTNGEIADVRQDILAVSSEIAQSADEILLSVSQDYATKTSVTATEERLEAQIQLQADNVTIKFDEQRSYTATVEDNFNASQEQLSTYIRFDIDGMELGKTGSPFMAELTNQELAFLQNGNKVAYINNNKLYITDAEVVNSLKIGKYAFIPRANGNTSFKWIG